MLLAKWPRWGGTLVVGAFVLWANLRGNSESPNPVSMFLDKLSTVGSGPYPFVAFILVLATWLFRNFFLERTQVISDVAEKFELEKNKLGAIRILLLGLDLQQIQKTQRPAVIKERFRLVGRVVTTFTVAITLVVISALAVGAWNQGATLHTQVSEKERQLKEIDAKREELQSKNEKAIIFAGGVKSLARVASELQPSTLAKELDMLVQQFLKDFGPEQLNEIDTFRIRLAKASLAVAAKLFAKAAKMIPDDDLRTQRNATVIQVKLEAEANRVRGFAEYGLHNWKAALVCLRRVIELQPQDWQTMNAIANCECFLGRLPEALAHSSEVVSHYAQLTESSERTELLALCLNNRGAIYQTMGKVVEAIKDYDKAVELYIQLVENEGRADLRGDLAGSLDNRGTALRSQDKLDDAIRDQDKALALYTQLVEKEGRAELRNQLADCLDNRAVTLSARRELDDAIRGHNKAIGLYTQLVEKEGRTELRHDLALALKNRGNTLRALGMIDDAIRDYDKALGLCIELGDKEEQTRLQKSIAVTLSSLCNYATSLAGLNKFDDSFRVFDKAIAHFAELVDKRGRTELRFEYAACLGNRAFLNHLQGKHDEAIRDLEKTLMLYTELVEKEGRTELRDMLNRVSQSLAGERRLRN